MKTKIGEERYEETLDAWVENKRDRLLDEGDLEGDDEPQVSLPDPNDAFDTEELPGYADGDWPEFAPMVMETWVDKKTIKEHGHYVFPTLNAEYPVIDRNNEKTVVSLLEERGYPCARDDDLVWNAVWGG